MGQHHHGSRPARLVELSLAKQISAVAHTHLRAMQAVHVLYDGRRRFEAVHCGSGVRPRAVRHCQGITRLKLNCPPGTPPLAVKLLAQACAHFMEMGVQWLFISPISSFRENLLAFFAENKVHHGDLGMDRLSTMSRQRYNEGTTWVKLYHDEDYMDYCTLITLPKLDSRQTSMTWEAKDWPLSIFDLGAMLQTRKRWDVVHQRWLRGGKRTKDPKDEQEEDEIRRLAPYNFLYSLFGDGIIVVDTKSLAKFA